jgi:hypothetical protein
MPPMRRPPWRSELWWVAAATLATCFVASSLDLREALTHWLTPYEHWELDELPSALTVLAFGLAWYALRRRRFIQHKGVRMIRVLLADDHPVVRSGYLRLLDQAGDIQVIAQAAEADAAYAAFVAQPPEVLVTDLSMPGGGGLDLMRRVLLRDSQARVLVASLSPG